MNVTDSITFGEGTWVYCNQHMRPHLTGWCTVSDRDKIRLDASDYEAAVAECRARGFKLFGDRAAEQGEAK